MPKIGFRRSSSRRARSATALIALMVSLGFFAGCSKSGPTDTSIENGIKAKMFSDAQLKDANITVTAHDGTVTLAGEVPSDAARADANQIAKAEPGVTQVSDQMTVPAAPPPSSSGSTGAAPPAEVPRKRARAAESSATEAAAPAERIIPSGTQVSVRTNDAINSQNAAAGQTYSASIAADVRDGAGSVAIPKGSDAQLVILKSASGQFTTQAELALALNSVTVAARSYRVTTGSVVEKGHQGLGKNKRTAEMTGGGAALGALIGAIAGKGKGAAIGAAVGAAGGAGAQVLTKGKSIRVPAETVLTFKLSDDLRLSTTR